MKVHGPLMSMEARGLIGERLVFSKRSSGQQARFQKAQKDKTTIDRDIQRSLYQTAVNSWNVLSEPEKQVYRDNAKNLHMSGYNLFMRERLDLLFNSYFHCTSAICDSSGSFVYVFSFIFNDDVAVDDLTGFKIYKNGAFFICPSASPYCVDNVLSFETECGEILSSDVLLATYDANRGNVRNVSADIPARSFSDLPITKSF